VNHNERLSKELRNRAEQAGGHPISFDDVKRSARKMKWQQRAAAGGVVAVVLAIAVPVGLSVANNGSKTPPASHPSPTIGTPSTTPSKSPSPSGATVPLTVAGAPSGQAPQVAWLQGTTAHLLGGGTDTLPKAYIDLASYHGGWLAIAFKDGAYTLDRLGQDGTVVSSLPGSDGFAVSADLTQLTWWEDGKLVTGIPSGMGDGESSVDTPAGEQVHLVGYASGGEVVYQTYGVDPAVFTTDFQGQPRKLAGALAAGGVAQSTGVVALQTSSNDTGSCWEVRELATGDVPWKTCEYSLGQFSTDGRYVIGYPAYADGIGPRDIYVLDAATGNEVVHYQAPAETGGYLNNAVWDGDSHSLMAVVFESGSWQLARLGLDGAIETASEAVAGDELEPAFFLGSRP